MEEQGSGRCGFCKGLLGADGVKYGLGKVHYLCFNEIQLVAEIKAIAREVTVYLKKGGVETKNLFCLLEKAIRYEQAEKVAGGGFLIVGKKFNNNKK